METQIFYWTGVVIWWGICLMVIGGIVTLVIITPLFAFSKSRLGWWRWFTAAKFADLGWTQDEINDLSLRVGGFDDEFLKKAEKILIEVNNIK